MPERVQCARRRACYIQEWSVISYYASLRCGRKRELQRSFYWLRANVCDADFAGTPRRRCETSIRQRSALKPVTNRHAGLRLKTIGSRTPRSGTEACPTAEIESHRSKPHSRDAWREFKRVVFDDNFFFLGAGKSADLKRSG